jgi:glycine hydroxymethyltransferase
MLVDLTTKDITGKEAEASLGDAGITVNKNAIPFDRQSRFVTSGVRIGTPAVTSRGLKEPEMDLVAAWINQVIVNRANRAVLAGIRLDVRTLCERYPLYPELSREIE